MQRDEAHGAIGLPVERCQHIDRTLWLLQAQILVRNNVGRQAGVVYIATHAGAAKDAHAGQWSLLVQQQQQAIRLSVIVREAAQIRLPAEGNAQQRRLCGKVVRQIQQTQRRDALAQQLIANRRQRQIEALQHRALIGDAQQRRVAVPGALGGHNLDLINIFGCLQHQIVQANVAIDAAQKELLLIGTEREATDLRAHGNGGNCGALHFARGQLIGANLCADVALARDLLFQRDDLILRAAQKVHAQRIVLRPAIGNRFQLQAKWSFN